MEESIIKKRGSTYWHQKTPKEDQYKMVVSKMTPEEREKERRLRVQENRGMSEFHAHNPTKHPFESKEKKIGGIREQYIEGTEYISPEARENINDLIAKSSGKEREGIIARLKGYKSAEERKEIRTRLGREATKEARGKFEEQNYDPASRYHETIGNIEYKIELAKENIKKLASPAGFIGGLIGAISPKMTTEERIKAEREKARVEKLMQKRKELLEERKFQIEKAAAYGSGHIPRPVRVKLRSSPQKAYLKGFGNIGGFSAGSPTQRIVRRETDPFGAGGYFAPASRPVQKAQAPQKHIVRDDGHNLVRIGGGSGGNLVGNFGFGGMGKSPVDGYEFNSKSSGKSKKKSVSGLGTERYF